MAALTTKNIKQLKDLPQLSEISLDDLLLLQDKSDDNEPYKRTTIGNITANLFAELQRLMAQSVFDFIFPVKKATVVQFPMAYDMETHKVKYDTEDPNLMYNNDIIRSTWVELDFDGAFFRANGGLAENFGSGLQGAQLPNVRGETVGKVSSNRVTTTSFTYTNVGGAFKSIGGRKVYIDGGNAYTFEGFDGSFSASDGQTNADGTTYVSQANSVYKDGGEVRPANFTVRVWRRTA